MILRCKYNLKQEAASDWVENSTTKKWDRLAKDRKEAEWFSETSNNCESVSETGIFSQVREQSAQKKQVIYVK